MKSIARAILVGSLIVATQAAMADDSTFPTSGDDVYGLTYGHSHTIEPVTTVDSPFSAAIGDVEDLSYGNSQTSDPVTDVDSPFPASVGDVNGLTYGNNSQFSDSL